MWTATRQHACCTVLTLSYCLPQWPACRHMLSRKAATLLLTLLLLPQGFHRAAGLAELAGRLLQRERALRQALDLLLQLLLHAGQLLGVERAQVHPLPLLGRHACVTGQVLVIPAGWYISQDTMRAIVDCFQRCTAPPDGLIWLPTGVTQRLCASPSFSMH